MRRALLLASLALVACSGVRLSEAELSDPGIKARLEAQLGAYKEINMSTLSIDVHSKIVTISGIVYSWNEKQLVERVAKRLRGPRQVLVNVVIQE